MRRPLGQGALCGTNTNAPSWLRIRHTPRGSLQAGKRARPAQGGDLVGLALCEREGELGGSCGPQCGPTGRTPPRFPPFVGWQLEHASSCSQAWIPASAHPATLSAAAPPFAPLATSQLDPHRLYVHSASAHHINMAQYELSATLSKYLDRHLIFPLLEFLQDKGIYNEEDIMKSKIALLQKTNMVDFAMDIYKELYQVRGGHQSLFAGWPRAWRGVMQAACARSRLL